MILQVSLVNFFLRVISLEINVLLAGNQEMVQWFNMIQECLADTRFLL